MKNQLTDNAKVTVKLAHLIEEYDTQELNKKLYARMLNEATGLHFDTNTCTLYATDFKASGYLSAKSPDHALTYSNPDPDELLGHTIKGLEKTYGTNWRDDLRLFQDTEALFSSYYFRKEKQGQYAMRSGGESILGYVLDYIVNGVRPENYARTHQTWEEKHPQYGGTRSKLSVVGTHTSDLFPGMSIRVYANGRIDIKGLTAEQYDKLDELQALAERIRKTLAQYV